MAWLTTQHGRGFRTVLGVGAIAALFGAWLLAGPSGCFLDSSGIGGGTTGSSSSGTTTSSMSGTTTSSSSTTGTGGTGGADGGPTCNVPGDCTGGGPCATVACNNHACDVQKLAAGMACMGMTGYCDATGTCAPCADIPSAPGCAAGQYCYNAACASCTDGMKDGDETDVDCGGAHCSSCPLWQDVVGVTASGYSLTKTGTAGWNAGAATTGTLSGTGNVQFKTAEVNTDKIAGLSHVDPAQDFTKIDFAFYLTAGGYVNIYEHGASVASSGTYAAGDTFEVQVNGTVVTYLKNGSLLHTSTQTPTFPLLFGAVLFTNGATIKGVSL